MLHCWLKGDDWKPYNAAARYLLGAGIEPALAMQLADRSLKLKEEWNNVWTRAQLLHAAGKNAEAVAAAQRAQTLGKASKNFFEAEEVARALVSWKKWPARSSRRTARAARTCGTCQPRCAGWTRRRRWLRGPRTSGTGP